MFRFINSTSLTLTLILIIFTISINADVPQVINYQGRLTDGAGEPVTNGMYLLRFNLYDAESGGASLWDSQYRSIQVTDGFFSYLMGDSVAIPGDIFLENTNVWLGIKVSTDPEMTPRSRISSAGFAFKALHSDTAQLAENAELLDNNPPSYYLDWNNQTNIPTDIADGDDVLTEAEVDNFTSNNLFDWNNLFNVPAGFADGVDDEGAGGSGDITAVNTAAGSGLTGGVTSGDANISIADLGVTTARLATGSVTTDKIADRTITNSDIAVDANILPTKISGTAVNLNSSQTITGTKTFNDLNIDTTLRRLALSANAIVPGFVGMQYERGYGEYIRPYDVAGIYIFTSNVSLPDGAIVTQMEGTFLDDNTDEMYLALIRFSTVDGSTDEMASLTSAYSINLAIRTDNSIDHATIDNENYVYYLLLYCERTSITQNLRCYGAEIEYTITKPLP